MPGTVIWLTGLPCAGKTTLAHEMVARLPLGRPVEVLDGDEVRRILCPSLGFSPEERERNVKQIAFTAAKLAKHGVAVIVAVVSPHASGRDAARSIAGDEGVPFVEVYVHATLPTVIARDVKGMYKRAIAGELASFTGISAPYEPPAAPDLTIDTEVDPPVRSAELLCRHLGAAGLL